MNRYWVSMIVQDKEDRRPWLLAFYDSVGSIDSGMEAIHNAREKRTVLSAWIDTFDESGVKHTVFHECYIDAFGYLYKEGVNFARV